MNDFERAARLMNETGQGEHLATCAHDWHIWPETDGLEQRCSVCHQYRTTPDEERFWLVADAKRHPPKFEFDEQEGCFTMPSPRPRPPNDRGQHPNYLNVARAIVASVSDDPWAERERADTAFSPQALANSPRPPNDRRQGRKALPVADKLVVGSIRLSPAQWVKLERLGGAAWLRKAIDKAK